MQGSYKNKNYRSNNYKKGRKYTSAEKIAFRLGQEQKVRNSLQSANKNSRVYDSFLAGFKGITPRGSKPLFSN